MSMKVYPTSENTGQIEVGGVARLLFAENGDLRGSTTPGADADGKTLVTLDMLRLYGGMPRFTPYVWGGRGDAMPEGDTQSSGQQLLDLMYPDMRADVVATQFTCTEAEWQADPYKRVTHWSLGDGVSWMRPPDKNLVQPGSVEGGFYASGVGSASALLGTAVLDQMQAFKGRFGFRPSASDAATQSGGPYSTVSSGGANETDVAIVEDGGNGAPRLGKFTRPRTWYGIWMIRMYGRVVNAGLLDAPALNARMDMIDARLSAVESDHHQQYGVLSSRAMGGTYTNDTDRLRFLFLEGTAAAAGGSIKLLIDGKMWVGSSYPTAGLSTAVFAVVPPGKTYSAPTGHVSTMRTWIEVSA